MLSAWDNEGYVTRKVNSCESQLIDNVGRLHLDLGFQDCYILKFAIVSAMNNINFKVKLQLTQRP